MKKGWTYKKLGEVATFMSGYTPAKDDLLCQGKYPYFKVAEMNIAGNELFMRNTSLFLDSPKKIFPKGAIIFPKNGGAIYTEKKRILEFDSVIDLNTEAIVPTAEVDLMYLYYWLNYTKISSFDKGGGLPSLDLKKMSDSIFPVPLISEQHSIVSRLDAAFAHIGAMKANAEKQLTEARQLFQAELVECMRPKEGWEEKSFVNCIDKVPKQKQVKSKDYKSFGNYPVVSQEKELISGYWDDDSYLYKHERPIIIFGDHTKEIKYVDFNFVVGADGTQILSPKKGINARFFYYALVATPLRTLGYARHFKLLKEKTFFIPPLDTQDQIVSRLDALSANIKKLEELQRKTLAECDALKQAMLREVFE